MSIKETIRAEIDRQKEKAAKRISKAKYNSEKMVFSRGELSALYNVGAFIDTLPEQPVIKKSNALFDKCVENCDPAVMKEVSDNVDKLLGRQPAEGLEDEIATWIPNHIKCEKDPDLKRVIIKWAGFVAHHFAEWGAEHLRDTTKMIPDGLEEAAKNRVTENGRFPISEFEKMRIRDIEFGAKWMLTKSSKKEVDKFMSGCDRDVLDELYRWRFTTVCQEFIEQGIFDYGCAKHFAEWQKAKMMETAVEGKVAERIQGKLYVRCKVPDTMDVEFCDKVKVIIVKEDEK